MRFPILGLLCAAWIPVVDVSAGYVHPYGSRFEPELISFKGDSIVQYQDIHADTVPGTRFTWKYKRHGDGRADSVFEFHSKGITGASKLFVFEYKDDTIIVDYFGFFGYDARGKMDGLHYMFFMKFIFDRQGRLVESRFYNPCCSGYAKRPPAGVVDTMHYEMYSTYEYQDGRLVLQQEFGINDGILDPLRKLSRTIRYSYDPSGNTFRIEDDNLRGVRTIDLRYPGGHRAIVSEGCCSDTVIFAADYRPLKNSINTDFAYRSTDYYYKDIPANSVLGKGAAHPRVPPAQRIGTYFGFHSGRLFDLQGRESGMP